MVPRKQWPSLALIAVGIVLLVVALPPLTADEYTHSIEPASQSAFESAEASDTDAQHAVRFSNLSSPAQAAVRAALESDDGTASTAQRAPEFRYGDTSEEYYIAHADGYYRLTTAGSPQLGGLLDVAFTVVAFLGALAVLVPAAELLWKRQTD